MSNVAYIPVIGQSMVASWFEYPSVLQAFKDEFLKLRPEYSDVVLYDAARGGSATTQAAALAYANIRGGEGTDAYNAVLNNYWVSDDLTDGTDLQLFLPRLANWAADKTIFGAIFDLGETDTVWMNSPEKLAEQNAATDYLLSRIESVIGSTTFYVQAVGDRAYYKASINSGADPMHAFQQDYAATHANFRLATETYDLPTVDSIHLTEAGFIAAAIRMADAMALGTTTATEDFATAATNGKFYVSLDLPEGAQLADLASTNGFRIVAPDGSNVEVRSVVVDKAAHVLVITPSVNVAGATLEYASATYSFSLGHDDFVFAGSNPLHPFTVTPAAAHESISASAHGYVISDDDGSHLVQGFAGADVLYGNGGNDTLDGGAGVDRMVGGTGNDSYYVDNYGDKIVENAGEGTDSVFATANTKLSANVENLTLQGSAPIWGYGNTVDNNLTGNDVANKLYGLAGNDVIDGKGGVDLMFGGVGDDTYVVDSYGDRAIEKAGEGTDSVFASTNYKLGVNVENLTLTGSSDIWGYGNTGDNSVTGNDGANKLYGLGGRDTLIGRGGNDWLEGGAGQDHLTGGAGSDSFVFRDGDFGGATVASADEITDFTHGDDHIRLNYVDANTLITGDQAFAFLGTAAFDGHAGELRYEQIGGNTYVEGDTNGDGVADFMIRVDGLHALTSGDFIL